MMGDVNVCELLVKEGNMGKKKKGREEAQQNTVKTHHKSKCYSGKKLSESN